MRRNLSRKNDNSSRRTNISRRRSDCTEENQDERLSASKHRPKSSRNGRHRAGLKEAIEDARVRYKGPCSSTRIRRQTRSLSSSKISSKQRARRFTNSPKVSKIELDSIARSVRTSDQIVLWSHSCFCRSLRSNSSRTLASSLVTLRSSSKFQKFGTPTYCTNCTVYSSAVHGNYHKTLTSAEKVKYYIIVRLRFSLSFTSSNKLSKINNNSSYQKSGSDQRDRIQPPKILFSLSRL